MYVILIKIILILFLLINLSFLLQYLILQQILLLIFYQQYLYKSNKLLDINQILNHIIIFNMHLQFKAY